jgi:hypothetical protein
MEHTPCSLTRGVKQRREAIVGNGAIAKFSPTPTLREISTAVWADRQTDGIDESAPEKTKAPAIPNWGLLVAVLCETHWSVAATWLDITPCALSRISCPLRFLSVVNTGRGGHEECEFERNCRRPGRPGFRPWRWRLSCLRTLDRFVDHTIEGHAAQCVGNACESDLTGIKIVLVTD